jgi:hypothetical protein
MGLIGFRAAAIARKVSKTIRHGGKRLNPLVKNT